MCPLSTCRESDEDDVGVQITPQMSFHIRPAFLFPSLRADGKHRSEMTVLITEEYPIRYEKRGSYNKGEEILKVSP
ncbi:hypothetical protein ACTXT7_007661 [Hymenolepis weldensis]